MEQAKRWIGGQRPVWEIRDRGADKRSIRERWECRRICRQQNAFDRAQRYVHHIVAGPAAVREAGEIAPKDTERFLRGGSNWRDAGVEAKHFRRNGILRLVQSRHARQEYLNEVVARSWRRGNTKKRLDEGRQRGCVT